MGPGRRGRFHGRRVRRGPSGESGVGPGPFCSPRRRPCPLLGSVPKNVGWGVECEGLSGNTRPLGTRVPKPRPVGVGSRVATGRRRGPICTTGGVGVRPGTGGRGLGGTPTTHAGRPASLSRPDDGRDPGQAAETATEREWDRDEGGLVDVEPVGAGPRSTQWV